MRCRLTVGASSTSTPLRRHSNASSRPSRSTRATSQVAASAVGDGTLADGSRSSQRSPRTPAGPSDVTIRRSPIAGSSCSAQKSAPVSRRTFCSRLSAARRSRRSSSMTRQYGRAMRALLFDVFGTCVDWRTSDPPRGRALRAARRSSPTPGAPQYQPQLETVRSGRRAVGEPRRAAPDRARPASSRTSELTLPEPHRDELVTRLAPPRPLARRRRGPDRSSRRRHIIAPCSNGHIAQSVNLAKYAKLPWDAILGAEIAHAYKPDPRVYSRSVDALGLRAARGLHGRRAQRRPRRRQRRGLRTAFVPRPTEDAGGPPFDGGHRRLRLPGAAER